MGFSAGALAAAVQAARGIQLEDCRHPTLLAGRCSACGRAILRPAAEAADAHGDLRSIRIAGWWFGECGCGQVVGESADPEELNAMHQTHRMDKAVRSA
jgi:hypothetical protein